MIQMDASKPYQRNTAFNHDDGKAWSAVLLPDFFVSFLSVSPRVNPHYQRVREESEAWISRKCNFSEKQRERVTKTDFSYFCAITVPDAGPEALRTVCDWGNWVFPFDDMFDNGKLKQDSEGAHAEMDQLLEALRKPETYDRTKKPKSALTETHNSVWFRVLEQSSKGTCQRFVKAMTDYCEGALHQVDSSSSGTIPDPESFLATRRKSAGVSPLFALVEYAYALDIPDEVFECGAIREIERIGIDLVLLHNDALSYCKEQAEGVNHNLVALYRLSGLSAQAAFNKVEELLRARYKEWYLALASLPQWRERIDAAVQKYIQGVQNVVLANLNWSFKSERYLGVNKDAVRANRLIDVLPVGPLASRPTDWNMALRRKYKHLVSWVKCYVYTWLGIWR